MLNSLDNNQAIAAIMQLPRHNEHNLHAFFDFRIGGIITNPRLMLIPIDDHMVHRGDGVFETIQFQDKKIYNLQKHLDRIKKSCSSIYIEQPCSWDEIHSYIIDTARASKLETGMILLFIGRGSGGFSTDYRECPKASLYIVVRHWKPLTQEYWLKGVTAVRSQYPAKQGLMAHTKSVNYLLNVLMKREAILNNAQFSICFDHENHLAEGASENVILVDAKDQILVPENKNILSGTTLNCCLNFLKQTNQIINRPISESEIYQAKEMILLGTGINSLNIVKFNNQLIADGKVGEIGIKLHSMLKQNCQDQIECF